MTKNYFSVPIYFIVFRETLEAAIIVSVLLGLVEQIIHEDPSAITGVRPDTVTDPVADTVADTAVDEKSPVQQDSASNSQRDDTSSGEDASGEPELTSEEDTALSAKRLVRKLRIQIFLGSAVGLFIALAVGAAFIAVWFTQASNLWAKSEELWEGIFSVIAAVIIFVMGITMLKIDRAKTKWRIKLQRSFSGRKVDREGRAGRWVLFLLPLITVLREGMEAVIFVGGVSLGQPAVSIPIAAICGFVTGLVCGYLIYSFASRTTLTVFMVVMTNFILLIGAGLFSKALYAFEEQHFNDIVGADVDDTRGDGPGSFNVRGSVWHLDCCNPENNFDNGGWMIFNAIFGWTNSASVATVMSYVAYWVAVIVVLIYLKFKEGRTTLFGKESAAGVRRREHRVRMEQTEREKEGLQEGLQVAELPQQ